MLTLEPYLQQQRLWPATGRHILAQYDEESIVVYQAYTPGIGRYAAQHQRFGAGWSRTRMSWIKPNFLWMMYRCGWAVKERQECVLALKIRRSGFDEILRSAVPSSFGASGFAEESEWTRAVAESDVRLQWDPDHAPNGAPQERRAIQLGLRRDALARFADEWIVGIEDVTPLVTAQHAFVREGRLTELMTPSERVYPLDDPYSSLRRVPR
jgi:hypothetical protein